MRLVSRNEVVAAVPAARDRLRPVQNAVLERDHHLVQLAELGHQLRDAQLFSIGADRTAGNAIIARALIRLPDEIHLEGRRILPLFFRRVPFDIFHDALFVFRLAPVGVQIGPRKVPFDVIQRAAHYFLNCLRRNSLAACKIWRNEGKSKQFVLRHGIIASC